MTEARNTRMNVGFVVPGFSADESDWCIPALRDLVRAMALEDTVRVCALRYPYRAGRYDLFGAEVAALGGGMRQGTGSALLWARALAVLASEHRRRRFDVLHAFWGGETGAVATIAGALLRVPVVLSLAGGELVGLREIGYGGQLARAERAKTRLAMGLAARVTAGSGYMLGLASGQQMRENRGARASSPHGVRIRVPLGVDPGLFRPGPGDADSARPRLVQVASLVPVKDQVTLLSAAAILRDRGHDFRLEIAGVGPLEAELRLLAGRLDLQDRVLFCGAVPHDRLPAFYAGAVAFVQSSRHEAQGMALLEAAACGVPVAGTRVGVLPELEPECAAGCGVGDPEGLADAVATLLDDRGRAATMGSAARAVVESEYSLEMCVERFRAIYAGLG